MFRGILSIFTRFGTIVLIGYIAWMAWDHLGPSKPETGAPRKQIAGEVTPVIVEDIRKARGGLDRFAILYFANDYSDFFTDNLRKAIEKSGIVDLRDRTVIEKARKLLNLRHSSYPDTESAVERGRSLNVQAVIFGTIHSYESYSEGTSIDVSVHIADTITGGKIYSQRYAVKETSMASTFPGIKDKDSSFPWLQRFFGWFLAVLLLPVFTISFIRSMVRNGSNQLNAMILAVFTLVNILLAWLLVGAAITSWASVAIFIAAIVIAFIYNLWIMSFALRLEEE